VGTNPLKISGTMGGWAQGVQVPLAERGHTAFLQNSNNKKRYKYIFKNLPDCCKEFSIK